MLTAIRTVKDRTTLTLETSEELYLEQMGATNPPIKLIQGANHVVVGAGIFKVLSTNDVHVSADTQEFQFAVTPDNKDGGPIDPITQTPGLDPTTVAAFLLDARSL